MANEQPTSLFTYDGPTEVAKNTSITLQGSFDPSQVTTLSVIAEDKYPFYNLIIDPDKKRWQVTLSDGFYNAGARWIRLRATGKNSVVSEQIVNLTVLENAGSVGQDITLKILTDTLFKSGPVDSSTLGADQKMAVKAGQTFTVKQYESMDGHVKVELTEKIAPFEPGQTGYFFATHVQLTKGDQVLPIQGSPPVPTPSATPVPSPAPTAATVVQTPVKAQLVVSQDTLLKLAPEDSSKLSAKQVCKLTKGQSLAITGYAFVPGHMRVTLASALPNFGDSGFIFWQHAQITANGKTIPYDPKSTAVNIVQDTFFKKRPVDSGNLKEDERFLLKKGAVYGVSKYTPADGHVQVTLTENINKVGDTGFFFPKHIQLLEGGQPIDLNPSKVELNVPYYSQRDNEFRPFATCNVTSIAMVLSYYGVRPKGSLALEDEFYQWCVNRFGEGSQTDNSVLVQLVEAYGFKDSFNTNRTWDQVKAEIREGRPVVVGGYFTHSGHIVTIIGFTPTGYIINDPYGNALSGYADRNGQRVFYDNDYMEKMCDPEPGAGHIYAHFISKK